MINITPHSGSFPMLDFLGVFIFHAAMRSLFNEKLATKADLYPAFVEFDKFLPYAVAGINIDNMRRPSTAKK